MLSELISDSIALDKCLFAVTKSFVAYGANEAELLEAAKLWPLPSTVNVYLEPLHKHIRFGLAYGLGVRKLNSLMSAAEVQSQELHMSN